MVTVQPTFPFLVLRSHRSPFSPPPPPTILGGSSGPPPPPANELFTCPGVFRLCLPYRRLSLACNPESTVKCS